MSLVEPRMKTPLVPSENGESAYRRQRARKLELSPYCEAGVPGQCSTTATLVHHIAGRRVPNPHAQSNLLALCHGCHLTIHDHPEWATRCGFMSARTT